MKFIEKFCRWYMKDEFTKLTNNQGLIQIEQITGAMFLSDKLEFEAETKELRVELKAKIKWSNHRRWVTYNGYHKTKYGLKIPPNIFINLNDKELLVFLKRNGYFNLSREAAASKLEEYIFKRQSYIRDTLGLDDWEFSSITFRKKKGDCEDGTNFFIACMTLLGFGEYVVGIVNEVDIPKAKFKGSHAYAKVEDEYEEGLWHIVDWNFPLSYRDNKETYDIINPDLNYMWNAYGTFRTTDGGTI